MNDRDYIRLLQDRIQALNLSGDALASALGTFIGHDHELIKLWKEAKDERTKQGN